MHLQEQRVIFSINTMTVRTWNTFKTGNMSNTIYKMFSYTNHIYCFVSYPSVEQKDSSETKRKLFEQTDSVTISRIVRLYQKGANLSVSSRCSILIV